MTFWRGLFAFAAVVNLAVGATFLFMPDLVAARLGVTGPAASYVVGLSGLLIAIFGVAYAMVAWNPAPNRNLVVLGALGKSAAAVLASWHAYAGHISNTTFFYGVGDLAFALMFTLYLRQTRGSAGRAPQSS